MWEPSLLTPSACVRPISDMQDYLFFFCIIELLKKEENECAGEEKRIGIVKCVNNKEGVKSRLDT